MLLFLVVLLKYKSIKTDISQTIQNIEFEFNCEEICVSFVGC